MKHGLPLAAVSLLAAFPALAADVSVGYVPGPGGYYNPTDRSGPYTLDSSGGAALMGTGNPQSSAAAAIAPIASTGSALVAKAGPGNLYGYNATAGGSAAFVAVLNAAAAPAAGAAITPLECSAVPASGTYRTRQDIPDRYGVGIVLVFTSSCSTYTAVSPVLMAAVVQ